MSLNHAQKQANVLKKLYEEARLKIKQLLDSAFV